MNIYRTPDLRRKMWTGDIDVKIAGTKIVLTVLGMNEISKEKRGEENALSTGPLQH